MIPRRVPLICRPTPMHRLDRLSEDLGVDLWIKRDDLTGFAGGGNKGRKIEFLIAEAIDDGAEVVVCQGASQSNFVRQLGAACAMVGIDCHAVVMDLPYFAAAGKPPHFEEGDGGNLVLDELFGVQLHRIPDGDWDVLADAAEELAKSFEVKGKCVKLIQIGGSSAVGAYSFDLAGQEVVDSGESFDFLVTPSSSGSTHAGLTYCFKDSQTKVIGISADPDPDDVLATDIVDLCAGIDAILGQTRNVKREDVDLRMNYCGVAYGIPSPEGIVAIARFAKREGVVLDPVYTSKAAAGLFDLIETGQIFGRILFWHTGGFPTLFAIDPLKAPT